MRSPADLVTPEPGGVWLRRLALRNFRNLCRVDLDLPSDGIAVVGENGHGKTNLLEAVYYLELLRSVRGARDLDVVRFGEEGFHVSGWIAAPAPREIAVGFERVGRRKRARIDGTEPERLSDAIGGLPAVLISPRDVSLVSGAPVERRRYLDIILSLTSRRYLSALQSYRGALARRNAAMREVIRRAGGGGRGGGHGDEAVAVWEPALAKHGAVIWEERLRWVEACARRFTELCHAIGERGAARLSYVTSLPRNATSTRENLIDALAARRGADIRRGVTMVGPHRDDLDLTLEGAGGQPRELRSFGSAGQQRTAAIALRMLEGDTLREKTGVAPLSLLDDPFAELDARRSARVLELFAHSGQGGGQVVLAVPRDADIPSGMTSLERWRVEGGELRRSAGASRGTSAAGTSRLRAVDE
ncbi:MAG: DNA replication/repair protein RecF [Gemmatimonadaceae bacterium]